METLLISVLVLMLILALVYVLCNSLPGLAGYRSILMLVVLIIGIIYILRGSSIL